MYIRSYSNYWTSTETYEALKEYILCGFDGLKEIILVGINYNDDKKHTCQIERYIQ